MLNFLRKLRRSNMNSKYLKYAIGEIVLVVIGILIALSIGDWNEERKWRKQEYNYLLRLEADLLEIADFLNSNPQGTQEWTLMAKSALNFLEDKATDLPGDSALSNILTTHANLGTLFIQNATYEEMLSNGTFSRIENDSLKSAISFAYKLLEDSNDYIAYFRQELSGVTADIRTHIDLSVVDHFSFDRAQNVFKAEYDLQKIRQSKTLKNALAEVVDTRYDMYTMIDFAKQSIGNALLKVQIEIKDRD